MKAIRINQFVKVSLHEIVQCNSAVDLTKEYHDIEVSEVPKPQVKDEEILVRVAAAGVNFVDSLYVSGSFLLFRFQSFERSPSSEAMAV
jgi:NADPH:quinone reductase-like Zn-dependent oxidoreductase